MKKTVTYIFSIFVLCLAMMLPAETAFAANVSLSVSKSSIEIGNTVTVTVTVPENISGTLDLIYPKDLLEFSKASAEVNSSKAGTVAISIGKYGLVASNKVTITFKAKTAGTATVSTRGIDFFDNNGESDTVSLGDASTQITIKNETTDAQLSSDYYLAKLNITAGSNKVALSPSFSYKKINYTATVEHDVTDVVVSVTRSSGKAKIVSITGNGKVALNVGENVIEIVVQAENGKTLTYKVTVTRKEKPVETPDPGPVVDPEPVTPDFEQGGESLYVVETPDDKIPENFVEKTVILSGGKEVLGLSFEKADLTVLYMENDNKVGNFYIYNAEENSICPLVKLSSEKSYIIVLMPEDEIAPEGYTTCTLSIEGKGVVNAYQLQSTRTVDMSDFYLLYCVNNNGTKGWYQYDTLEGTFQRYIGIAVTPDVNPDVTPDPEAPDNPDVELPDNNSPIPDDNDVVVPESIDWTEYKTAIICGIVFIAAVIVILIINLILTLQRKANAADEDEDEDEEDDEYEYFDEKAIFKRTPQPVKEKVAAEEKEEELPKIDIDSVMESESVGEANAETDVPDAVKEDEEEVEFLDL